ncbi:MAG: hypothetical protein EOO38_05840 [Cytophagaceae bacterium]|nr:MAG: hypothetical protein EOO38_05840 [Cytophagaceae bacterium]
MPEDAQFYRRQESAERLIAATTNLANVRARSLRAAERWDELATKLELVRANTAARAPDPRKR